MIVPPSVAVVIVNYRTPALVISSLAALSHERARVPGLTAMVVDGGSEDGSAEQLARHVASAGLGDWVAVLPLAVNGGFGYANNHAIRLLLAAEHPPAFIHLLNPDACVERSAVSALVAALAADVRAGAAGSRLFGSNGEALGSAFRFPSPGSEFARGVDTGWLIRRLGLLPLRIDSETSREVDWVTGASVMFRTDALRETGLFDEGFFLYFEEAELMHRLRRKGWRILHVPESRVVHDGGAATGVGVAGHEPRRLPAYWYRSRLRYFARTAGRQGALAANLAWLAGRGLRALRALIDRGARRRHPPFELRDTLAAGLWPSRHDLDQHGVELTRSGFVPPAWTVRR